MTWTIATGPLTPLDITAVAILAISWLGVGVLIDFPKFGPVSVSNLMAGYRRDWMQHSITRDPRVFDAMLMSSIRDGTAFFASACMIAIGGGLALMSDVERLGAIAQDLSLAPTPEVVWEVKILVVLLLITNAFLKFVWSNRIFGYCLVVMGSIPNDTEDPLAVQRADQAAELNIIAARSFNRGLRSVYFALGALAWLLGAVPLIVGTAITVGVVIRREFTSHTRRTLVAAAPKAKV